MLPPEYPDDEEYEDLLDQVSPGTRNRILEDLASGPEPPSRYRQWSRKKKILWWIAVMLFVPYAFVAVIAALICFLTIVLIPIGALLMLTVGLPGAWLVEVRFLPPKKSRLHS